MWQNFTFLATGSIWSFSLYSLKLNYVGLNNGQDLDILKHKQESSSVCYQQLSMVLVDKVYFAKKTRL